MISLSLRPYQENALNAVRASLASGKRAPILVAPTGSGKTVMAAAIIDGATRKGRRVLFLAHRFELVDQAAMKLAACGIRHAVIAPVASVRQMIVNQYRVFGRSFVDQNALVSVGTVQTKSRRIDGGQHAPDVIIIDECHLSVAPSYQTVVAAYPKAIVIGLTATPTRLDGKGLGNHAGGLYDDLIVLCQPLDLLAEGFLVRARIFEGRQKADLSGVRTVGGDWDKQGLAAAFNKPELIGDAVEQYAMKSPGRPAIGFCANVAHADESARRFREAGYRAVAVSGDTDPAVRREAVDGLANGSVDAVFNCALYIEGLDRPEISCVMLLSHSQSLTRYLQEVGRGARTSPGKDDFHIHDHAGMYSTHGHPFKYREWTLDGSGNSKKADNDNEEDVSVKTCPKCFANHEPSPYCPVCGHIYEVKIRKIEAKEGDLYEVQVTDEELRAAAVEKRRAQGQAQTVEELQSQGMSFGQASRIVQARADKQALIDNVIDLLEAHKQATGQTALRAFDVTYSEVRKLKPKPLKELRETIMARTAELTGRQQIA